MRLLKPNINGLNGYPLILVSHALLILTVDLGFGVCWLRSTRVLYSSAPKDQGIRHTQINYWHMFGRIHKFERHTHLHHFCKDKYVDIDTFVKGCMRMKGPATSIDMLSMGASACNKMVVVFFVVIDNHKSRWISQDYSIYHQPGCTYMDLK